MAVQERIDEGLEPLNDREGWMRKKREGGIEVNHCGADFQFGAGFNVQRDYSEYSVILLTREIKDTLVSCYFQLTLRNDVFEGSLNEFLRSPIGLERILAFYRLWENNRLLCHSFKEWRYEDLFLQSFGLLHDLFRWMDVRVGGEVISQVIEECSFENLNRTF